MSLELVVNLEAMIVVTRKTGPQEWRLFMALSAEILEGGPPLSG
jgi:hypothetical protein